MHVNILWTARAPPFTPPHPHHHKGMNSINFAFGLVMAKKTNKLTNKQNPTTHTHTHTHTKRERETKKKNFSRNPTSLVSGAEELDGVKDGAL